MTMSENIPEVSCVVDTVQLPSEPVLLVNECPVPKRCEEDFSTVRHSAVEEIIDPKSLANTSLEYSANKADTASIDSVLILSKNIPKANSIVSEAPAHERFIEESSSIHHTDVKEIPDRKSFALGQHVGGCVTLDKALLCPIPVDASGDGFSAGWASDTPKNVSRLSVLSANVSPWSNVSMSEVERKTITTPCQDSVLDGSSCNVDDSKVFITVDTPPSNSTHKRKLQNSRVGDDSSQFEISQPETLTKAVEAINKHCVPISPPTPSSSSHMHGAMKEVPTPYTPCGKDGVDVSVLIDTAARNIEMASELLNETPQRRRKDMHTRSLVDQGTSFSPQGTWYTCDIL